MVRWEPIHPERLAPLCRRYGVRRLALFGSALRDMIAHAEEAMALASGKTRGDLDRDRVRDDLPPLVQELRKKSPR